MPSAIRILLITITEEGSLRPSAFLSSEVAISFLLEIIVEDGLSPRRFISSEKESSTPSLRCSGLSAINVPAPLLRSTKPSRIKFKTACRAVIRLTSKLAAISTSEGSACPGRPAMMISLSQASISW